MIVGIGPGLNSLFGDSFYFVLPTINFWLDDWPLPYKYLTGKLRSALICSNNISQESVGANAFAPKNVKQLSYDSDEVVRLWCHDFVSRYSVKEEKKTFLGGSGIFQC